MQHREPKVPDVAVETNNVCDAAAGAIGRGLETHPHQLARGPAHLTLLLRRQLGILERFARRQSAGERSRPGEALGTGARHARGLPLVRAGRACGKNPPTGTLRPADVTNGATGRVRFSGASAGCGTNGPTAQRPA
ncbi:MAG: hypothetical protein GY772_18075 [bacterium]|nr:hypothetical protein [bacterium]